MSEWIFPDDNDPSTWWPANQRVLAVDENGWIVILNSTENGFELDDGGEAGGYPIAWTRLPEPPK